MTEAAFLWFFGPSAAGKRHIIEHTVWDADHPLRSRLRLRPPLAAARSTLDGRHWPTMQVVFEEIDGLVRSGTGSCLIKAQRPHLEDGSPTRLREKYPDARHETVLVWTDPAIAYRRARARGYAQAASAEDHENELRDQVEHIRGVGLPIIWLYNGTDGLRFEAPAGASP